LLDEWKERERVTFADEWCRRKRIGVRRGRGRLVAVCSFFARVKEEEANTNTDGYHGYVYNGFEEPGTGPGGAHGKGLRGVAGGSELVREA
jgi:hypothetical protein